MSGKKLIGWLVISWASPPRPFHRMWQKKGNLKGGFKRKLEVSPKNAVSHPMNQAI